MPLKSGIDVHNDLRLLDNFAAIPFILVSGLEPSPTVELQAEKEGLTTVMLKPSSLQGYQELCTRLYDILLRA